MSVVTIVGAGMMGSALAFPARENGHEVRLVGTHLDREIIETCKRTGRHPKFERDFPAGIRYCHIEEMEDALSGADLVIGGVSSFGVDWFGEHVLPAVPEETPVLTVTKGLFDTPDGKLLTYPALWEARLAERGLKRNLNAVGGPCTSYELVAHDQTEVAFCGRDPGTLEKIRSIMATDYYHISLST
ncbi:MAG: glycerol-3-phosphate dehydrogenase, partial [Clostridia bacterium]|nr:glycerol-3-phosphate dehydrogenase [Clostridia bacterium]